VDRTRVGFIPGFLVPVGVALNAAPNVVLVVQSGHRSFDGECILKLQAKGRKLAGHFSRCQAVTGPHHQRP